MTDIKELAACPFCGGADVTLDGIPENMIADCCDVSVRCFGCGAVGPSMLYDQSAETDDPTPEAIAAWNRRASPPSPAPAESGAVAWMTADGRIATDETKRTAMASPSRAAFNIPLFPHPPAPSASMGKVTDATELCAAFEHAVTQQTQAYEFQRGTTPGKWLFRCSDWIDLSAVLASLPTQESEDGR